MRLTLLLVATLTLLGCDSGNTPNKTPEQIQAEVEASQKQFAEERQRIERENKAREEKLAYQRSLVSAQFLSVDEEKIMVQLTNLTDKDLDNLAGSLEVLDLAGNSVTSIGLTNWVPGDIYLHIGETTTARKGLDLLPAERRATIVSEAQGYTYQYTVFRYQFDGEDEVQLVQAVNQPMPPVPASTPTEPAQPLPPEPTISMAAPCQAKQVVLLTVQQHYPGSQCEHVSRNLDSERFKQEYIQLCQNKTGSTQVASVQMAFCGPDADRGGISYTKQLCCSSQ